MSIVSPFRLGQATFLSTALLVPHQRIVVKPLEIGDSFSVRRAEHSGRTLLGLVVAMVLGALLFWAGSTAFRPADSKSLRIHLAALRSSISEALLLLAARDSRKLIPTYYRTEMILLSKDVESTASRLRRERAEPSLLARFQAAARRASSAAAALQTMTRAAAWPESVVTAQATLAGLRLEISRAEMELGP
jgi:hypothetical protein